MELKILFDQQSEFKRAIDSVYLATGDLTIPFKLMAREWYRSNASIFKLKGPGRYVDLSTKPFYAWWEKNQNLRKTYLNGYKSYKQAKWGFAYPILKASGRLEQSITNPQSDEAINYITPDKSTLVLGTKTPYAIYHQSDRPRKKMPYRPMLFVGVEQIAPNDIRQNRVKNWLKILDSYFEQKAKQNK